MRPQAEIDEQLNLALDSEEAGRSRWPGMTYEQGVEAAIRWVTGQVDDKPMADT